jgi:Tol biopolymer transport system component
VYIKDLRAGTTKTVLSGPGNYRAFTFDRDEQQFAFTTDRDQFGREGATPVVYHGNVRTGSAQPVIKADMLPPDTRFPDNFSVAFNRAGTALTFNIAPPPEDTIPADSLVGKAKFDLWHWKDPALQPQQLLQVNQARNPTYQSIYHLAAKKLVRLTYDSFPSVNLSDDGKIGVMSTGVPYNVERMWGDGGNDIYLVDPMTGTRKLVRKKLGGNAQLSPDAKYLIFFDDAKWHTYNVATGKETDITGALAGVSFEQETWSTPGTAGSWGVAGWTQGDRSVLIYDRFDIWEIDPMGVRPAVMVTDSAGRRDSVAFRLINLGRDLEERYIDATKPLYLRAFS